MENNRLHTDKETDVKLNYLDNNLKLIKEESDKLLTKKIKLKDEIIHNTEKLKVSKDDKEKHILKDLIKLLNAEVANINVKLIKYDKEIKSYEKAIHKLVFPNEFEFIWKVMTGILGFSTLGLIAVILILNKTDIAWMGVSALFIFLFLLIFIFLIYLGKKTHAILEFKAIMSGKPISLFFTDHKRVDWKVIEPEGNILVDKQYGAFVINEKGAYIDKKTKNVFLAFNPAAATNASVECFKMTDGLNKVLKDEKQLAMIRFALMNGQIEGDDIVFEHNGQPEKLSGFGKLRENVDFSHLKSLLNTLIPHAINSKIEMTIQQRLAGIGRINWVQIALIFLSVIGAVTLAIIMLNMYGGGGGGTTTIVQQAPGVAEAMLNSSSSTIIAG